MHLKKLEIQGFKSFPEYTLIEFDEGMTAIVGPNGSGKSNVTDAIRWVLGEQSVRMLRGGKMEDVIFNGTQSRRAMNYAEVSMTLDNSDGLLGIDYTEVQVTRRLYRSGESEYQLNHVNCRLKDILQLFMDTGLGKDGYSIVGQGRVDDILSTRSEDRRKVLEEASGIVKYKARKDEAERKLLSTEQNLVRIKDILSELESQIDPLRDQAEKAKHYHRIHDEWKALDIGVALHLIDRNQAFLQAAKSESESLEQDIRVQEDLLLELRTKNRELSEASNQIEDKLEEARRAAHDLSEQVHADQNSIAVLQERKKQLSLRVDANNGEEDSAKSEVDRLMSERSSQQKKIQSLRLQKDKYARELASAEEQMAKLMSSIDSAEKKLAQLKKRLEDLQDELFDGKERAQSLSSDLTILEARIKTLSQDRLLLVNESDGLSTRLEDANTNLKSIVKQLDQTNAQLTEKKTTLAKLREEDFSQSELLEQKKRALDNTRFRIRTLEELEKNREGYQEPVRRLLTSAESDPAIKSSIVGILGELIRVPAKYETAIEIALGQAVHNIVTNSSRDAGLLIDHLKKNNMGRATFLPIEVIRGRELEPNYRKTVTAAEGFLGVASDLVTASDEISEIIKNLLGRIVITDHLKNATRLAAQTGHVFRIVTLEGDVVNPGGSMTGGSIRNKGTGLLGRARELEGLQEKTQQLDTEIKSLFDDRAQSETKMKGIARDLALFDERVHILSMEKVRTDSTLQQLQTERDRVSVRLTQIDKEKNELASRKMLVVEDIKDNASEINSCEKEISVLRQTLLSADDQNRTVQEELDDLRNEISNLRISVGSIDESLRGSQEIEERITREQTGVEESLRKRKAEREQAAAEILRIDEQDKEKLKNIQILREQELAMTQQIKKLQMEKDETEQEVAGYIDRLSAISSRISSLQSEYTRMEAKTERFSVEVDDMKNRMWEEHELTYDNANDFRIEVENLQVSQKRLSELRSEMKDIGPVNLSAVDEFDRVNDRYALMQRQMDDITNAKENLTSVIASLVTEMKEQFLLHFNQINENFKIVFSDLFNGGTAEILLEDQDDVLSCNIDIKAQPPGKKLQSLTLLSGGERCLTAIALLFAILQLRPSPFCVLDEVEAALDDVNVNRFTDFVRRYTEKSQFILVTHRKGTMEACDRMYGVTMQERGISKILSMRLGES